MRSGAADQVRRASARPSTLLTRTRASTSDNIGLLARGPNSGGTFSPREPKSLMSAPSRRRNGALPTRRQASPWHLDGSLDAGNNGVASKCTIRRRRTIRAAQCTGAGDYPGAREVFGRASGGGARSGVEAFGSHPLPAQSGTLFRRDWAAGAPDERPTGSPHAGLAAEGPWISPSSRGSNRCTREFAWG